jgi:DNA-binding XRE family transcriptional regulator
MDRHKTLTDLRMKVAGIEFVIQRVPAEREGDKVYTSEATIERIWLLVAHELVKRGITDGAAFKFMRKAAKFTAARLAQDFDVSTTTISSWETGEMPVPRTAWGIVADEIAEQLGDHGSALERLHATRQPRRPQGVVALIASAL